MSNKLQLAGETLHSLDIPNTAPSAASDGIDMSALPGNMKPSHYLVTAVVTVATTDLYVYGLHVGTNDEDSDDDPDLRWGLYNDLYGTTRLGKLGTGLVAGTHHFIVPDLGIFARVAFKKSAGTCDIFLSPIYASMRGN